MNTEVQNDQNNGQNKIEKAYEAALGNVVALFGGPKNLSPSNKVESDSTSALIEELIKEEREARELNFKTEAKKLLKEKVEFDKVVAAKTNEFEKAIAEKKKEFTIKANKVIALVKGIDAIRQSYVDSLKKN